LKEEWGHRELILWLDHFLHHKAHVESFDEVCELISSLEGHTKCLNELKLVYHSHKLLEPKDYDESFKVHQQSVLDQILGEFDIANNYSRETKPQVKINHEKVVSLDHQALLNAGLLPLCPGNPIKVRITNEKKDYYG